MRNTVGAMEKPDEIKDYLKDQANNWKGIMHQNCMALTQIYESQSVGEGFENMKARFASVDGQYQAVSYISQILLSI
jgi:hypothetical protein